MDGAKFGRLARALTAVLTRRRVMAISGAAAGMMGQREARGFQLGATTCGEEGAVCTLVFGCCDGLTCVTSAINTSYGVCVPGEGGMISTGTKLISPFSETAVEEVSALMEIDSSAPTTDPRADRKAHIAEIRARRAAKRSEQRTRLDTPRSTAQLPGDGNTFPQPRRPQLRVELQFKQVDGDSETVGDQLVLIEVVQVTNRGDADVVLTRIEPIEGNFPGADLTTSQFKLSRGKSYSFVSGLHVADAGSDEYRWMDKVICNDGVTGQGYRLSAASSLDTRNYSYTVLCTRGRAAEAAETTSETSRDKKMRNDPQHKRHNGRDGLV